MRHGARAALVAFLSLTSLSAAAQPEALEQVTQRLQFTITRATIAGMHRVPLRLFKPEYGVLKEAVVDIEGRLIVGADTTPHVVDGVPVPYPIGFTLKQLFEGPFTVGRDGWANLEGGFLYADTAPGTGGYVGFDDRDFAYRVVVNEATDESGQVLPDASGPDVPPGPVGGILFSFVSSPQTEGYVSWVAALLGAADLDLSAGRMYFPVVGAVGTVTITYRYRRAPEAPLPPMFPDIVPGAPEAPLPPVPVPYPNIAMPDDIDRPGQRSGRIPKLNPPPEGAWPRPPSGKGPIVGPSTKPSDKPSP